MARKATIHELAVVFKSCWCKPKDTLFEKKQNKSKWKLFMLALKRPGCTLNIIHCRTKFLKF